MARFRVQCLTASGAMEQRVMEASSAELARAQCQQLGLQVLDIRASGGVATKGASSRRFDLALFSQELLTLLKAGLSLIEALETLEERQAEAGQSDVLTSLLRFMQQGKAFSQSLAEYPEYFPDLFVATIAASEQTGEMVDALERYLRYSEQVGIIRQKIISASLYPAMLVLVGSAVAIFLLCFLVPRFSHIYEGMGKELPLASRLLMQWGAFASEHVWLVAGALILLTASVVVGARRQGNVALILAWLAETRWLGAQMRLMQLSRFYRALGLLLKGGIPVLKSLQMTQALLPPRLQSGVEQVAREVSQGKSLSESLVMAGLSTPVALRLVRAGERNGQVADMLEQVASFHDKEVATWIEAFTRLFEPVLMLIIGGVIGGIVVLLYLPIFELAGSVQ